MKLPRVQACPIRVGGSQKARGCRGGGMIGEPKLLMAMSAPAQHFALAYVIASACADAYVDAIVP